MASEWRTFDGCCVVGFWLGAAAIVCGIAALATLDPVLFQVYLALTLLAIGVLTGLRWWAGGPLKNGWATAGTALPLGFLAISIVYLVPISGLANNAHLRTQSVNSLKQIAFGLLGYQEKHKHLPASAICDLDRKPLLSWRVAILPFLGEEALYRQFNLDEPWDSSWNIGLLKRMPAVYHTTLQPGESAPPHTTFYQVFVGPGTAFEPGVKVDISRDIPDGVKNTILVVEAGNSVPWTKPEDLVYDPREPLPSLGIFRRDRGKFPWRGGEGTGTVSMAFCDGHVRTIQWPGIREETLRNAIIRNDGKFINLD
jgi:prepilin-type processing-associated H-X9-DG protein